MSPSGNDTRKALPALRTVVPARLTDAVTSRRRREPSPRAGLELLDACEQLACEHGADIVEPEVATQATGTREPRRGVARERRGIEQPEPDEAANDVGMEPGLARERCQLDGVRGARPADRSQAEPRARGGHVHRF